MTSEATQEAQFEYDRSVVGVQVPLGEFTISADQVKKYCETMGEANPKFTGGEIAPPGMLSSVSFGGGAALDPKVKFGNTTFMAGTRMELSSELKVGQPIKAQTSVKEVYGKTGRTGTMVFVVRRTEFLDAASGQLLGAMEQSTVHRETEAAQ
jgi:N-terminal half of MaoC dehydratase